LPRWAIKCGAHRSRTTWERLVTGRYGGSLFRIRSREETRQPGKKKKKKGAALETRGRFPKLNLGRRGGNDPAVSKEAKSAKEEIRGNWSNAFSLDRREGFSEMLGIWKH